MQVPPALSPRGICATGQLQVARPRPPVRRLRVVMDMMDPPSLVEVQVALKAQVIGPSPAAQVGCILNLDSVKFDGDLYGYRPAYLDQRLWLMPVWERSMSGVYGMH